MSRSKNKPKRVPVGDTEATPAPKVATVRMVGVIRVRDGYCAVEVDVPIDADTVSVSAPNLKSIALAKASDALLRSAAR